MSGGTKTANGHAPSALQPRMDMLPGRGLQHWTCSPHGPSNEHQAHMSIGHSEDWACPAGWAGRGDAWACPAAGFGPAAGTRPEEAGRGAERSDPVVGSPKEPTAGSKNCYPESLSYV
jgi:hypothetical protein